MKTNKYFMISVLALLACGCQDEDQAGVVQPTPGEEVQFGVALEQNADTRTIYGEEAGGAFPIYWVNGDEVIISSPECAEGRKSATYKVKVTNDNQNYANSLDKTGEAGLQWGSSATANFYSVYPAPYTVEGTTTTFGAQVGTDNHTYTLTMPAQQDNNIVGTGDNRVVQPDMKACFMYAATKDVNNGDVVNLKYKSLSTALRFTLQGPATGEPVTISYVRIYAPDDTYINGTFTADLSNVDTETGLPTLTVQNGRNYVTMNAADASGTYLTLAPKESIELNAFLLIAQETTITSDWYIEVGTDGVTYRKNLDGTSEDGKNMILVPGKVHRLRTPLPQLNDNSEWDASNWMVNIQRNVYLSEISIPGSWNSLNSEFQPDKGTTSISTQYGYGVRAFHLDTRWKAKTILGAGVTFSSVDVLGIANGGKTVNVTEWFNDLGRCMTESAPTFVSCLEEIVSNVKDNEYMVVVCTFAQDSYNYIDDNGGDWRHAISDACNRTEVRDKIVMGSEITPETVVGDVLGKVIVIINTYTEGEVADSKCLFFNMGMTLVQDYYRNNDYYESQLLYKNDTETGITLYGTHAQVTAEGNGSQGYTDNDRGYMPTIPEREKKAGNILSLSQKNYSPTGQGAHNAWLYIGLGGYTWDGDNENHNAVTDELNPWMQGKIDEMETNQSYYPVGIVFINNVYSYSKLVNDILQMNNKYRKAYDHDLSPVDGKPIDGSSNSSVQSAAPGYSSGMIDNRTDAIGWTRSR